MSYLTYMFEFDQSHLWMIILIIASLTIRRLAGLADFFCQGFSPVLIVRFLGATTTVCNSDVKIYVTKDFRVFLCNTSDNDLRMSPGELFGFGLGSFSEKLAGQNPTSNCYNSKFPPWFVPILQDHMMSMIVPGVARSSGKDCVAWLLGTDADMVVCAGNDGKKALPLAEARFDPVSLKDSSDTSFHDQCLFLKVVCGAARDSGIMEVQVCDYDLTQAVQVHSHLFVFCLVLSSASLSPNLWGGHRGSCLGRLMELRETFATR